MDVKFLSQTNHSVAIINDFYSEKELKLIWRELNFLTNKFLPGKLTGSATNDKGEVKSNSGIFLDDVYNNRDISDILTINRKIFDKKITSELIKVNPIFRIICSCNSDTTLISYYKDEDSYFCHSDQAAMTILSYFFNEPQKFSGGELIFSDFNLKITPKNNMVIIFPGCYRHEVLKISLKTKEVDNYGRYCMSQFLNFR